MRPDREKKKKIVSIATHVCPGATPENNEFGDLSSVDHRACVCVCVCTSHADPSPPYGDSQNRRILTVRATDPARDAFASPVLHRDRERENTTRDIEDVRNKKPITLVIGEKN